MKPNTADANRRICEAFKHTGAYSDDQVREIAFHLTDWIDDLVPFAGFLENPSSYDDDEAMDIIIKFLAHAPDHLHNAAERVLDPK